MVGHAQSKLISRIVHSSHMGLRIEDDKTGDSAYVRERERRKEGESVVGIRRWVYSETANEKDSASSSG